MKRKILAVVLAFALVFTCMPLTAFAASAGSTDRVAVSTGVIGTAKDAMTVDFDKTLNILALGDSIAAGYGLNGLRTDEDMLAMHGGFSDLPSGVYSDVMRATIGKLYGNSRVSLSPGPVCVARVQDICTLIDDGSIIGEPGKYEEDWFYSNLVRGYILKGTKELSYNGQGEYPSITKTRQVYKDRIRNADLITITVGGNNFYSYVLASIAFKSIADVIFDNDLSRYFSKTTVDTFNLTKRIALAEARTVDRIKGIRKVLSFGEVVSDEETVEDFAELPPGVELASVEPVSEVADGISISTDDTGLGLDLSSTEAIVEVLFNLIESVIYTAAASRDSYPDLIEMIHNINPEAKIVITGIPMAFCAYKIKISDRLTISLKNVLSPIFALINRSYSRIADRYDFVRYVDISAADLITTDDFAGNVVPIRDITKLLVDNLDVSHPSAAGHSYIAEQILKEVKFDSSQKSIVTFFAKIRNTIERLITFDFPDNRSLLPKILSSLKKLSIF